jgi:hypothetical protein
MDAVPPAAGKLDWLPVAEIWQRVAEGPATVVTAELPQP